MKIKIVHILHAVGGVDVSLRLILANIDSDKFESIVIHGDSDKNEPFLNDKNIPIKNYPISIIRNINPSKDYKAIKEANKIIKNEKPELIHVHSAKGGVIGKIVGKMNNIPVLHTPQAYSFLSANSKFKKNVFLTLEKFLSKWNNKILASSNSEKNRALEEVGYNTDRVLLFNNSINAIDNISNLSIEKTWPDDYICSVGRPSFQKNIELMIEILHQIKQTKPNIHLVLMGVGYHAPNLGQVKSLIANYNLESNITLLEWTQREDIFNIIKNSKLYISTARYEGLPYSVIEALALGKACVVTDADGNRDLITHNTNGYVIFDENVKEFANKVDSLLKDDQKRTEFENASLEIFDKNFNIENTISSLEAIYIKERKK
ncbi:glycosyltransferase [Ulvibacter antarcticus]|uniref:Glycosyltransferase involved in cell wall biosynthesis n=1 Tax=Ulvibacter antarcticus TaxID=442714 RepID=A0A3L9Z3H5_9FLAO|nr:glycosyltransferase [Ulvibacter antarcticus]RMA65979.1 glycosyltransferase involved in cell wall biosynthesis [Ulvibacter antarcticus]